MTVKTEVVPDDHCRRMQIEQLLEFMRCPYLYRLKWIEGRQAGPKGYPDSVFRRSTFWACMTEVLKSYGLKADEDQVRRVSESVILQRRTKASPDLVGQITDLVWSWWQQTLIGIDEVLRVDTPFALPIEEEADTWHVCGTVPLVIREQGRPQPTVILPLIEYPIEPGWLENDLLVPITLGGAVRRFNLPIRTIRVQILSPGAALSSQEPEIAAERVKRAEKILGTVRQSILESLFGTTWWPNRQAPTCRQSQCPLTLQCIQTYGGTVAP